MHGAELEGRGPLWTIFTPLAVDADPERMKAVLDKLRAASAREDFEELTVAMTVVADKDKRQRGLRGAIISALGEEVVMESWVFKKGKEQGMQLGKEQGEQQGEQRAVVRLFEKRLGRPLDEGEKATLLRRLSVLGYDRVVDVRDELSPEALAAWLANPEAA